MSDEENEPSGSKDRSPSPAIKSTAVVKYTAVQSPAGYAKLQCNTDLNLPPSNWLNIDSCGLKQILRHSSGFSSFRMAHMFPDSVGEVDVISGAECIKTLLKLPYQPNGAVSMMVHRVENTLLLDEFNIYEYLLKSEWSWLKNFFYENILKTMSEQERMMIGLQDKPSSALQLTSKFLCHSVASLPEPQPEDKDNLQPTTSQITIGGMGPFLPEPEVRPEPQSNEHSYNRNVLWTFENIQMLIGSDLPIFGGTDRPCVSLRLREQRDPINVLTGIDYWLDNLMCNVPEVLMCYHIDGIVQKYEPMKTEDLPTLEGSKFSPKVIKNVAQNILSFLKANATKAGHTYWLFKGMNDDVVKLYDLTSLCGETEKQKSSKPEGTENPFTTPVAMLLYRVARNMKLTKRSKNVKTLLENAIKLLDVERHPQIVASSHYMLADVYVPATTNPAYPDFKDESSGDSDCEDDTINDEGPLTENDQNDRNKDDATGNENTQADSNRNTKIDDSRNTEIDDKRRNDAIQANVNKSNTKAGNKHKAGKSSSNKKNDSKKDIEITGKETAGQLALKIHGLALQDIGKHIKLSDEEGKSNLGKAPGALGTDPPSRCGKALKHALKGLIALHNVTLDKCKEEERERLKQQSLIEEQHPKMANPYEPIKMNYEPLDPKKKEQLKIQADKSKEHSSRSRRRKRERKTSEHTGNSLLETKLNIDKNAILIRKENPNFPNLHEPNRDDNFAWKLHLKTLLYEKICLAYATLAEYSYSQEQYGFSLKCIDMAGKCQKLLNNMIIKSRVVDSSCLLGRAGDNYFQISKNWQRLEMFKKQFMTEHDIDKQLRFEIETDLEEETEGLVLNSSVDLKIFLPSSMIDAMCLSCESYEQALKVTDTERTNELLRRLGSVKNELGVRYMHNAQLTYVSHYEQKEEEQSDTKDNTKDKDCALFQEFEDLSKKSLDCLNEATEIFIRVNDTPNLALLYCNKGRYMRFRAHCGIDGFSSEKRHLYNEAETLYSLALKTLGARETCGACAVWDLVSWELSCHTYTRAMLMQEYPQHHHNEANEVADALKHALKHCLLSPGPRQYLYQFRAAMIYHRIASLYHKLYREVPEDGPKRRTLWNLTRSNYEQATQLFALLEDTHMFLTVQIQHVGLMECRAASTPNLKLKSQQTALQLLRQCHSIMKIIRDRDEEENDTSDKKELKCEKDSMETEESLLHLFESRLHFILKSLIQYCRAKSNRDYEKMANLYKNFYCSSLKIKKDTNLKVYAESICNVLENFDNIEVQES